MEAIEHLNPTQMVKQVPDEHKYEILVVVIGLLSRHREILLNGGPEMAADYLSADISACITKLSKISNGDEGLKH
jgi:hypothetical protein